MTNASGAGIVLEYRFRDSFCFHIPLAGSLGTEMSKLIERLKIFHAENYKRLRTETCGQDPLTGWSELLRANLLRAAGHRKQTKDGFSGIKRHKWMSTC
jgi:hypothetical protein